MAATRGTGPSLHVDPARDVVIDLLTGRLMSGPGDGPDAVWRAVVHSAHCT